MDIKQIKVLDLGQASILIIYHNSMLYMNQTVYRARLVPAEKINKMIKYWSVLNHMVQYGSFVRPVPVTTHCNNSEQHIINLFLVYNNKDHICRFILLCSHSKCRVTSPKSSSNILVAPRVYLSAISFYC